MTSSSVVASPSAAVLLVDDHPANLVALEAVLAPLAKQTGARLLRAGGADEALRHVMQEDGALAVVVLDVMMPGTDGLETARLIRQRTRSEHVPIIFVTALDADRERLSLGYRSGAVDYLTKPFDPDVLRAKIRAFVDLHRRRTDAVLEERRRAADEVHALREKSLREEAALIATVQRVGTALASELDLERVVQLVIDETTALTRAEFGAFFYNVYDPARGGEAYTLRALAGVPHGHVTDFPHPRSTPVFGPTSRGESVRSDDITRDRRYRQMESHQGMPLGGLPVRSYLAVPVRSRTGEVFGGLFFGHEQPGVFAERDERLIVGIAGWAAVAIDNARLYTAERRARESAEASRVEAETANRVKSEFLAVMSHELRTPLNAIGGYTELLEIGIRGPVTEEQRTDLRRIQASQRHLLGLINEILNYARIETGTLRYDITDVPVREALIAAETLVGPQAREKGIAFAVGDCSPELAVRADSEKLRQILVNLLSNAVKFTDRGEIEVSCMAEGASILVRVRDTGIGIPADKLETIFDPFVQVRADLTRTAEGTGLGLAISRDLARAMGGELTATSEPGTGSTFMLTLPGT